MDVKRKISDENIELIKNEYTFSEKTLAQLGKEHSVSSTTIWKIVNDKKHTGGKPQKFYKSYLYGVMKGCAKRRGIEFIITFEEWCNIWEKSGKFAQRGRKKAQYCMARFGDKGPYAIGNVEIITNEENIAVRKSTKGMHYNQGTDNYWANLTKEQVLQIRSEYRRGIKGYGQYSLSRKFGVSEKTIHNIVNGKTYLNV